MAFIDRLRGQRASAENVQKAAEAERAGLARLKEGNLRQAESDLRKAVGLNPHRANVRGSLGLVLIGLGRLEDANKELEDAIKLDSADDTLRHTHGQVLEALLRLDEAAIAYGMASTLNPRSTRNVAALASVEIKRGNLQAAEAYARKALELDANEPKALADLAEIRHRQGDLAGAIQAMQRTVSIRKDNPHDHFRLGLLLEEAGDLDSAIDWLRIAHDGLRADPKVVFALGRMLMKRGRRSDAMKLYERVMADEPANRSTYMLDLSRLKAQYGETLPTQSTTPRTEVLPAASANDETEIALAAASEPPVSPSATLPSWWVKPAAATQVDDPIARLEAEVAADPNNSRLRRGLSTLYLQAGRLAEAKEQARLAELARTQRGSGTMRGPEPTKG